MEHLPLHVGRQEWASRLLVGGIQHFPLLPGVVWVPLALTAHSSFRLHILGTPKPSKLPASPLQLHCRASQQLMLFVISFQSGRSVLKENLHGPAMMSS